MSAETANRNKKMSAHLKEHGVTRETGQCPWGCGTPIRNGGQYLLAHLNTCKGPRKKKVQRAA